MLRDHFIPILWPDREKGPYIARVRLDIIGGRPEAVELVLGSIKDDRPITWDVLRRVSMPELILAATMATLGGELDPGELLAGEPLNAADMDPAWAKARASVLARAAAEAGSWQPAVDLQGRRSTRRYPAGHLERVAAVYTEAHHLRQPPTKAVADTMGLSYAAAAKQVLRARRHGLLKPTTRGKAAAAPDDTTSARTLAGTSGRRKTK